MPVLRAAPERADPEVESPFDEGNIDLKKGDERHIEPVPQGTPLIEPFDQEADIATDEDEERQIEPRRVFGRPTGKHAKPEGT